MAVAADQAITERQATWDELQAWGKQLQSDPAHQEAVGKKHGQELGTATTDIVKAFQMCESDPGFQALAKKVGM